MGQKLPLAYNLFTKEGTATKYKKLLKSAAKADIILFGESHNDALGHWLQNTVFRDLQDLDGRPLALGMEMFEVDQQQALEDYLVGDIELKALDEVGEGVWPNFRTDYEPIAKWAQANGISVYGTNVPRKYARVVFREGFKGLRPMAESGEFPPLPIPYDPNQPAYVEMLEMMPGGHGGENFPKAQAIKDATMAWRISQVLPENGRLFHLNGSFHSDNYQGIYWYLDRYAPEKKVMTITVVEQEEVDDLLKENEGKADFIFTVPATMTKTY
ncbi:ChaN family lipoprotein [Lewinella sp. 4G2]|uniref:ChaN family lipoprotein n=1 Tax=Lewinella sp. 4G2 TaxID=1803372 RepID=UPI000ACA2D64|nr:ChaN family lipoprotein [Lewinella sp. 4G2]